MKKKLIAILVLVLIASLALTACKQEKDVKFICQDITVKVGQTPDFAAAATLTVDGDKVDDFQVKAELQSGNPTKAGVCIYTVSVEVFGTTYSVDIAVTFTSDTVTDGKVTISADNFSVRLGTNINWNERVTVTYDGTPVVNPELKVTKQSGDDSKEGVCLYKVVYTRDNVDYSKTVTVRYTLGDALTAAEQQALNAAFAKTYSSYSFVYRSERGDKSSAPDIYAFDLSKEKIDGLTAYIDYSYEDNNYEIDQATGNKTPVHDDGEVQYYWQEDDTHYKHTFEFQDGVWGYRYYGINFTEQLKSYLPYSFLLNEYGWDATDGYFEKLDETTFRVRNNLDGYCEQIIGNLNNVLYTDMRFTLTDGYITSLQVKYTMPNAEYEEVEYTVTYEWSDFNNVSITVPEAVDYELATNEHYVTGDSTELTSDEQTNVTNAFAKEYDSINSKWETGKFVYVCNYAKTVDGTVAYIESPSNFGLNKYYSHDVDRVAWFYQMVNDRDYVYYKKLYSNQTTTTANEIATHFYAIGSLGLTSDLFAKLGNKYVVKQDKLAEAYAKLNQALDIDGSQDNADKVGFKPRSYSLISCYFTLDGDSNITKLAMIIRDDAARTYETHVLSYSDFDSAVVTLPTDRNLQNLTQQQQTAIHGALVNDVYNKVTITDSFGDVYDYNGNHATLVETTNIPNKTETTEYELNVVDGKWYQIKGDDRVLVEDLRLLFINFDLSELAKQAIQYDALHSEYYVGLTHEQIISIVPFYSNYKDIYDEGVTDEADKFGGFTGIGFGLNEDGSIAYVTVYANEISITATYSFESTQPAD